MSAVKRGIRQYLNLKPPYLQEPSQKRLAILRQFLFRLIKMPSRRFCLLAAEKAFQQIAVRLPVIKVLAGLFRIDKARAKLAVTVESRIAQIVVTAAIGRYGIRQIFQAAAGITGKRLRSALHLFAKQQ